MSIHNLGFYEEIHESKIIPSLSSNIIIYTPYLIVQIRNIFIRLSLHVPCNLDPHKPNIYMVKRGLPLHAFFLILLKT